MSIRLEARLEQAQRLVQRLEQRLKMHVGHLERQLLKKVEYVNVDFEDPRSRYHVEMLGEFVFKESEGQPSFASQVLEANGVVEDQLEKVIIESFEQEDISLDVGTKRNVDRALLVLADGKTIAVTLSLDK
ncbi:MAG: hypothetical protein HYY50_00725 [Candidatus Kerfeldbacteria bacterium]|nr:hypothetical protein [Candidatus Kerfeldbacteria bacterium]